MRNPRLNGNWGGMLSCNKYEEDCPHPLNLYMFFDEIAQTKGGNLIGKRCGYKTRCDRLLVVVLAASFLWNKITATKTSSQAVALARILYLQLDGMIASSSLLIPLRSDSHPMAC